jgi:tetraacyldisaccharide 4'-kinase
MGLRGTARKKVQDIGVPANQWDGILAVASRLYGLGVRLRAYCLEKRLLAVEYLPGPVISVGNLTVGGTGKTPLVICVAQFLHGAGHKVAILSRGYARRGGKGVQLVSDGHGPKCTVEEAGDEPFMMAQRLKGVQVWVGKHRYRAGQLAWKHGQPDVFLLDDGFQHRRLHRDLDLVVLRVPQPFGNGKLLPQGSLREPTGAIKRADLVVVNSSFDRTQGYVAAREVEAICPSIPLLTAHYRPRAFVRAGGEESLPVDALVGKRVAVVCGIGNPEGFKQLVSAMGVRVVKSLFFPDHYWYTPLSVAGIRELLREVDAVVVTEKDVWKIRSAGVSFETVFALQVDLEIEPIKVLGDRLMKCISDAKGP